MVHLSDPEVEGVNKGLTHVTIELDGIIDILARRGHGVGIGLSLILHRVAVAELQHYRGSGVDGRAGSVDQSHNPSLVRGWTQATCATH